MNPDANTPILIGAGQWVQRSPDLKTALGPIDMMAKVARLAAQDAGLDEGQFAGIDSLRVVEILSGKFTDPVPALAETLGIAPGDTIYTETGGNSPQALVNSTAQALAQGEFEAALLCGTEVLSSLAAAFSSKVVPDWTTRDDANFDVHRPEPVATADHELPYGLERPINVYPLFENALRAHYGWSLDRHFSELGKLFSDFSEVAAKNPNAWFQRSYTPEEIATVSPQNRMIGFPYTKRMNAIIKVDQSAALIMTTVAKAREWDVDPSKWIYLHGCADALDHWYVTERENFHSSPALRLAGKKALDMAACALSDIDLFDLYSCFPSSVQVARDALGIDLEDPRPLTVTGGLPYHGGPSSNYVMHSIATMVTKLRGRPDIRGLCSAAGWFNTKHALGIYGARPVEGTWEREDPARYQPEIDAGPKTEMALDPSGAGTVETYTVICGRSGPERGIIVGRLEDGRRFLAVTPDDEALYQRMMTEEVIGQTGHVEPGTPVNTFSFDRW